MANNLVVGKYIISNGHSVTFLSIHDNLPDMANNFIGGKYIISINTL